MQAGYQGFIQLIETPDYSEYLNKPYPIYKEPIWSTDARKNCVALEQTTFYHSDQVGTPQTLSNAAGECVGEITQDTWGTALEIQMLNNDNPFEQTNLRFQGQYYDHETGLHYNRYRYYEPFSARYMSKDPIGLEGGMNSFIYVSDPTQWVDPRGLNWANAFPPGLMEYGRAKVSEHNWRMQNDTAYRNQVMTPPAPVKAATHVPYTIMTNVNVGVTAIAGASVGVGGGHTREQYGKVMQCVAITVCGSAKGAALIGGGAQACQNTDGSQTYSGNVIVGAGAGATGSICTAVNYCR